VRERATSESPSSHSRQNARNLPAAIADASLLSVRSGAPDVRTSATSAAAIANVAESNPATAVSP
jgi:hypothetical protein